MESRWCVDCPPCASDTDPSLVRRNIRRPFILRITVDLEWSRCKQTYPHLMRLLIKPLGDFQITIWSRDGNEFCTPLMRRYSYPTKGFTSRSAIIFVIPLSITGFLLLFASYAYQWGFLISPQRGITQFLTEFDRTDGIMRTLALVSSST